MQNREELQEIENIGESEPADLYEQEERVERSRSPVPVLQIIICLVILLLLLFWKFIDKNQYETAAQWYQNEMAQEIEMPTFGKGQATPVPESTPQAPANQLPAQAKDAALQMV